MLYAGDTPEGAVAEAFGNLAIWSESMFAGPPSLSGSERALVQYATEARIINLDDARALLERRLRPSRVVTRSREETQAWALRIYQEKAWMGVSWWSFYDADWSSFGIWDRTDLNVDGIELLRQDDRAVQGASRVLKRIWA